MLRLITYHFDKDADSYIIDSISANEFEVPVDLGIGFYGASDFIEIEHYDILQFILQNNYMSLCFNRNTYEISGEYENKHYSLDEIVSSFDSISLQIVRELKRKQLSKICEDQIINHFYNEITGERIHYGYDLIDQQNWDSQYEAVKLAKAGETFVLAQFGQLGYPPGYVAIKGRGNVPYNLVTYDQYIQFWLEGKAWVSYNRVVKYYPLLEQIAAAKTAEEVEAINWSE